jgi:hypothetical protein
MLIEMVSMTVIRPVLTKLLATVKPFATTFLSSRDVQPRK